MSQLIRILSGKILVIEDVVTWLFTSRDYSKFNIWNLYYVLDVI